MTSNTKSRSCRLIWSCHNILITIGKTWHNTKFINVRTFGIPHIRSTYKFTKINQILLSIKDIWYNCKPKTKLILRSFLLETLILYRLISAQDKPSLIYAKFKKDNFDIHIYICNLNTVHLGAMVNLKI